VPKDLSGSARANAKGTAPAAASPGNLEQALGIPLAERSAMVLDDPFRAEFLRPEAWPEVAEVVSEFVVCTGQNRRLARYSHDPGLKALVVLFAAGYSAPDVCRAVQVVTNERWWTKDGAKRGLASLSPEVVARALQGEQPGPLSEDVAAAIKRAREALAEETSDAL
jgi:hypothetical protein